MNLNNVCASSLLFCLLSGTAIASESYSPYVDQDFPRNVYFGDTHLHTKFSADAGLFGNLKIGPEEAYQIATGGVITAHNGMQVKMSRPLDFLVLSDHAEYLGLLTKLYDADPTLLKNKQAKRWYDMFNSGKEAARKAFYEFAGDIGKGTPRINEPHIQRSVWQSQIDIAERYNNPGHFSALIGYEWSASPNGNNWHRNVIFADGGDKVSQVLPFSLFDGPNPEDLWEFMEDYETKTGGSVFAIPHNGNLSNGTMFALSDSAGRAMTADYAAQRIRWEPLYEVTQIKGDAETHPVLAPNDEFADYERWDRGNVGGSAAKEDWMYQYEYARSILKLGLQQDRKLGVNPFKLGLIGSTDAHTGIPEASEDNYWGKLTTYEPSPERWYDANLESTARGSGAAFSRSSIQFGSAGYAAVWAKENTRESLFAAMKRREVYATTGPRMVVRFFGGEGYTLADLQSPKYAQIGYRKGVPMGGDLRKNNLSVAPSFMVTAIKDTDGANLDRVQIIKGWLDASGDQHEHIYNVAVSDGRIIKDNKVASLASTVNLAEASYLNSIGAVQLSSVWVDPDFNPDVHAFYYARVIEIPTPRWNVYDAKFFGVKMDDQVPKIIRERAYTSPIWYTP